jgi:hypothetical protein
VLRQVQIAEHILQFQRVGIVEGAFQNFFGYLKTTIWRISTAQYFPVLILISD